MNTVKQYLVPGSLQEAVQALADGPATLFAGGTDVMPQSRSGIRPIESRLMNIRRLSDMRGVRCENGHFLIGALTTITDILNNNALREQIPVLVSAADCFASPQVRNTATMGGNICNASPAGDMIIPLLLLDANVELVSWHHSKLVSRSIALSEFFTAPGRTVMQANEILVHVSFRVPQAQWVGCFRKFGTRPALDISIVSVGVGGVRTNGCLRQARVAFGAVAPTPMRGCKTEAALKNTDLTADGIDSVARIASQEVSPISDVRASAWYRTQLIEELTKRSLHDVAERNH